MDEVLSRQIAYREQAWLRGGKTRGSESRMRGGQGELVGLVKVAEQICAGCFLTSSKLLIG